MGGTRRRRVNTALVQTPSSCKHRPRANTHLPLAHTTALSPRAAPRALRLRAHTDARSPGARAALARVCTSARSRCARAVVHSSPVHTLSSCTPHTQPLSSPFSCTHRPPACTTRVHTHATLPFVLLCSLHTRALTHSCSLMLVLLARLCTLTRSCSHSHACHPPALSALCSSHTRALTLVHSHACVWGRGCRYGVLADLWGFTARCLGGPL